MYAGKLAEKAPTDVIINAPRHPYTQAAHRVASRGWRAVTPTSNLPGSPGNPPGLLDPPVGCRFRARCPLAFAKCVEEPPFIEIEPNHSVACWKAADPVLTLDGV